MNKGLSHVTAVRIRGAAVAALVGASLVAIAPAASALTSVVSDDFSADTLDAMWAVTDHVGDGSVQLTGTGSTDAYLSLSVPAGESHDAWGVNRSLRATQPVDDDDFSVEMKFDSVPSAKYQTQGLLVEQDSSTWLRFDVYHNGSTLRAFAGSTVDDDSTKRIDRKFSAAETVTLTVSRSDSSWTMTAAADGGDPQELGTFEQAITATAVGPFASNHGSGGSIPEFTALVDYVFDPAAPVDPEDDPGTEPTPDPTDEPTPDPTDEPTPDPTDEPTPDPTDEPTPDPTDEPTPDPTDEPTPDPTDEPTPDPTDEPTPDPTDEPTPDPTDEPTPDPSDEPTPDVGGVSSDDFATGVLDPERWAIVDPLDDATFALTGAGTADAHATISVPAGTEHDPWESANAARIVQPVADENVAVEVKFDSMPATKNQMQGLLFEEDSESFTRFGVYHNGKSVRLFASSTLDGDPTAYTNKALPALDTIRLRVTREADTWTVIWSVDGVIWNSGTTFSEAITLSRVGAHAGNAGGSNAPAYTAHIDYVFDPAAPIDPEDDYDLPPDETSPVIADSTASATATTAAVQWTTNEPTGGAVDFGPSTNYGTTVTSNSSSSSHSVTLDALTPDTTYHYRIRATDPSGNSATPVTGTFVTAESGGSGDGIDVWYGPEQSFGTPAHTQRWVNILGTVADPDEVTSLTYRLNGGQQRALSTGPDDRRLENEGDFNVDIDRSDLDVGQNTVTITAERSGNGTSTATVTVNVTSSSTLSLPYTVDWSDDVALHEQAQPVDGLWTTNDAGVRTSTTGYDRVLAVGDARWTDYEVTVPMTVHGFGPGAYTHLSGAPLIGLGVGWQGHGVTGNDQPAWGWYPVGAYSWYRFHESGARWELTGNNGSPVERGVREGDGIAFDTTYVMKVRAESTASGASYSMKWWQAGTPEPGAWTATIDDVDSQSTGSVALIAHHVDATFGDVQVTPLTATP